MEKRARLSLFLSAAVAGLIAFWGGWARRWISDDGLIVLRTVRNILAGNGPVFNVGERVEANTSTLWQYLIAAFSWVPGLRLEDVAMWLALICTVVGVVAAGGVPGAGSVCGAFTAGSVGPAAWPELSARSAARRRERLPRASSVPRASSFGSQNRSKGVSHSLASRGPRGSRA